MSGPAHANDHAGARAALVEAAPGRSRAWYQGVAAVAHHESGYGYGFRPAASQGLWNWGAITGRGGDFARYPSRDAAAAAAAAHRCPDGMFPWPDSDARGWYLTCFVGYRAHVDAARRLVRVLASGPMPGRRYPVRADVAAGQSLGSLARAMWAQGYYTGFPSGDGGALVGPKVDAYALGLARSARAIARALGEPVAPTWPAAGLIFGTDARGRVSARPSAWWQVPAVGVSAGGGTSSALGALVALGALLWSKP